MQELSIPETALLFAIQNENQEQLKKILENEVQHPIEINKYITSNTIDISKLLLSTYATPAAIVADYSNIQYYHYYYDYKWYRIEPKIVVPAISLASITFLGLAALCGNFKAVQILAEQPGIDLNAGSSPPLAIAAYFGQLDIYAYLVSKHADQRTINIANLIKQKGAPFGKACITFLDYLDKQLKETSPAILGNLLNKIITKQHWLGKLFLSDLVGLQDSNFERTIAKARTYISQAKKRLVDDFKTQLQQKHDLCQKIEFIQQALDKTTETGNVFAWHSDPNSTGNTTTVNQLIGYAKDLKQELVQTFYASLKTLSDNNEKLNLLQTMLQEETPISKIFAWNPDINSKQKDSIYKKLEKDYNKLCMQLNPSQQPSSPTSIFSSFLGKAVQPRQGKYTAEEMRDIAPGNSGPAWHNTL